MSQPLLVLPSPPAPAMRYDGQWTLQSASAAAAASTAGVGPTLANGKLAFVPSLIGGGGGGVDTAESCVAAGSGLATDERHAAAAFFHHARFRLFSPGSSGAGVWAPESLALSLRTGAYSATHLVTVPAAVVAAGGGGVPPQLRVRQECRALRHLPSFALHTLTLSSAAAGPGTPVALPTPIALYHELSTRPEQALSGAVFDCASVYGGVAHADVHTLLTGSATDARVGRDVHGACCYLLPSAPPSAAPSVRCLGLGRGADAGGGAHCKLLVGALPATVSVLVGALTDADASQPRAAAEELRQAVLGVLSRALAALPSGSAADGAAVAAALVAEHEAAWADAWAAADVRIVPKDGISPADAERLLATRGALRYAVFNLCSSLRVGGGGGGVALGRGGLLRQRDGAEEAWLLPVLQLLQTEAALAAVDARSAALAAAERLATGAGYRGAAFAFDGDTAAAAAAAAMWGASAPLHVFHTALVAVNAWNAYRLSQDRDWLQDRGYPLLRSVADFLASAARPLPPPAPPGAYEMRGALAFTADVAEAHNALTVHAAQVALRGAIEAAYELGVRPRAAWRAVRDGLALPLLPPAPSPAALAAGDVLRPHAAATARREEPQTQTAEGDDGAAALLLDVLMPMAPLLGSAFFAPATGRGQGTLTRNLDYHGAAASAAAAPQHPYNRAILACLQSRAAQKDAARVSEVEWQLAALLAERTETAWGNLCMQPGQQQTQRHNDVALSAMLVAVVVQGMAGLTVTGGVSETRFRYEPFGVRGASGAVLPPSWKSLQCAAGGGVTTVNRLVYAGGGVTQGQAAATQATLVPSLFSPWSANTLL
jgi:hypothetical protein